MATEVRRDKKKHLLALKEHLIKEIRDNEARINEVLNNRTLPFNFQADTSDSDDDYLDNCTLRMGPPMSQLKLEQEHLMTRLHATEELTGLKIVQSEVNILAGPPETDNDDLPTEDGIWKEVTAECRAENLRFTVSFYCHQPVRKFAPLTYHNLQVDPIKEFHAKELENSVLKGLSRPSDAVQVIRSYATACRSRRETLTQVLETFGDYLAMSKLPKGGYSLKCVGFLELTWVLENKWSPIAAFHHCMCFEVENVDEVHLKKIKPAHRQIRDPTIDTEERTMLLNRIIEACIEAKMANGDNEPEYSENHLRNNQRQEDYENEKGSAMMQKNSNRARFIKTSNIRESEKENIPTKSTGKRQNPHVQGDTVQKKIKVKKIIKSTKNSEQIGVKSKSDNKNHLRNTDDLEKIKSVNSADVKDKEKQKIETANTKVVPTKLTAKHTENLNQKKVTDEASEVTEKQKMTAVKEKETDDLLNKDNDKNKETVNKIANANSQVIKQKQEIGIQGDKDTLFRNKKVEHIKKKAVTEVDNDKLTEKKKKNGLLMGGKEKTTAVIKEKNGLDKLEQDLFKEKKDREIKKKQTNKKEYISLEKNNDETYIIDREHVQKSFSNDVRLVGKKTLSKERKGDEKEKKEKDIEGHKNEPQNRDSITKQKFIQKLKKQEDDIHKKDLEKRKVTHSHEFKKPKPVMGKSIAIDKKRVERASLITNTRDRFASDSNSTISKIPKSAKLPVSNHNTTKPSKDIFPREKHCHNVSKIPQRRFGTMEKLKDPLRMSPRFLKKPAAKPKTMFGMVKK